MIEIEKKDWEDLEKNVELMLKNSMMATLQYETALKTCREKIAEFPDEVKEIIDGLAGDTGNAETNSE